MSFSARNRSRYLQQLQNEQFDLLVIGGGITGAGIALDATARGLKVCLIEKDDFASGTSSRSTKLIHGGLRYLKQLEFGIVREVGQERTILYKNAPHIVIPERMLLPIIDGGSLGKYSTSLGLYVYDRLAGVEKEERRNMLSKEETMEQEPLLNTSILKGGGMYVEYRSDDARLTIEVLKTAVEKGALCLNYVEFSSFILNEQNKIKGAVVKDIIEDKELKIKAKKIINACGPWVDDLRKKDNSLNKKRLHLTKGIHIVLAKEKLPIKQAVYFDVQDGRMIFAIPRHNKIYIGTTDTNYQSNINFPYAEKEDVIYLLNAANYMFPTANLEINDIESTWAGLRPLIHEDGKSPSDLSRKDEIFISDSNLISIAGGKLTGFRKMAERSVNVVCKQLKIEEGRQFPKCSTEFIKLSGGHLEKFSNDYARDLQDDFKQFYLDDVLDLVLKYGSNTQYILASAQTHFNNNLLLAEAEYCLEYELTNNTSDFIIRRTGRLYFERPEINSHLDELDAYFNHQLNYTADIAIKNLKAFEKEYKSVVEFKA
ncbi:MAG TPA: glycerol-3-phosphate dehydrogenase/oxidase [Chitinophagales bacterium]|jgi:glycerol-3-phosphate dehydrogenase|nr:glycerol-3-phosphate dehydrogenase/oxidase [Chitinophagales bacterium]MBP6154661.1 glycerol-3-phosphate dehydrogenase/oxidase [Chitinophagales bacterium]HQV79009.1 glycerol-3-phosphate dehydrogenase/oxidase [Chitinophagales bacterium]HQW79949.1 glycerol-3-phosphate dehydrogenase/oxidase [Chitinophagales bacterium]HRB68369.1 glycerol-3-phosphate dehydrogenase/oxidase [Chitinophagales bacterium]